MMVGDYVAVIMLMNSVILSYADLLMIQRSLIIHDRLRVHWMSLAGTVVPLRLNQYIKFCHFYTYTSTNTSTNYLCISFDHLIFF